MTQPSTKPWFIISELAPWEYEGAIEVFRKGWLCSRTYDSWDRIDGRLDFGKLIWRPLRQPHPTLSSDPTIQVAIQRLGRKGNEKLFDAVPDNPTEA